LGDVYEMRSLQKKTRASCYLWWQSITRSMMNFY
jgi:hypothetical protein